MFSAQEKAQAIKFPNGTVQFAAGLNTLAGLCLTSAHTAIRPALHDATLAASEVWRLAALWFADLSGTPLEGVTESRERSVALDDAKAHYDAMLAAFEPVLAATSTAPDFATADAHFRAARTTFSGFDWSLGYSNPHHADVPNTPFDEPKTVVGPHGDWLKATASLKSFGLKIVSPWRDILTVYQGVPVYSEVGNPFLRRQIERLSMMIDKLSRIWAMHIEVETAADAAIINGDAAASNGERPRGFFRTLLQNELVFANRLTFPKNFRGRYVMRGIVENLQITYFQGFIVPLARMPENGPAWTMQLVTSGIQGRFHSAFAEAWMSLDAWAQAAFGFYHPLPDPALFRPVTPDGSNTPPPNQPAVIPIGFFNSESAQIATAKADAAALTAQLDQVMASLRAKEGTEL